MGIRGRNHHRLGQLKQRAGFRACVRVFVRVFAPIVTNLTYSGQGHPDRAAWQR